MDAFVRSKTLTVSINCEPKKIYAFVSDPANLPVWAKTFCRSVKRSGDEWTIDTPQGPTKIRLAEKNDLGVLDHYLQPPSGITVFVPMRVVPNAAGSEFIFTVFRLPHISKEGFERDIELVEQDLRNLKKVLEA